MLPIITYVDLETTGSTPLKDRITEIAVVRIEHGKEVARWQTLVNPEQPIPPFIQNLTGIDNNMVSEAPTFADVADKVAAFLEDATIVAHNARFDYGFLKSEFKRLNQTIRQKVLCTVKLSRKLYPEHYRHNLDAIMQRHQLTTSHRHRAMGDVEVMMGFIDAAIDELGYEAVAEQAQALTKKPSIPVGIDESLIDDIPQTPGVYLFYGDNALPLYIGKSINLYERVMSHFSADHASTKEMKISQEIKRIDWIETAGELGALLLESRLIKEKQPIYNRRLRREGQLCSWQIEADANKTPQVKLVRMTDIEASNLNNLYGAFRSKRMATEALRKIAEKNGLCLKILGLETGKGRCFATQLKKCKGACCDKEPLTMHHLRLQTALTKHKLQVWPYDGKIGIKEVNSFTQKTEIHLFDQWCHITTVDNDQDYHQATQQNPIFQFDLDTYKLVSKVLLDNKLDIIHV